MKSTKGWHLRRFTKKNGYKVIKTYTTLTKVMWGQLLYSILRPWADTDIRYY